MRSWFFAPPKPRPPVRAAEATPAQLVATGALGGSWDPMDQDGVGWRPAGAVGRPVPEWTQERARQFSVAAYRSNPMAKAIVDTYTTFCVGDSGVKPQVSNPLVGEVVDEFWDDPRNSMSPRQELYLRSELLNGESLFELLEGEHTGVVRLRPHDPSVIREVRDLDGNPLTPDEVCYSTGVDMPSLKVARFDDRSGLREGEAAWHTPFRALVTDQRSQPFLSSILDWLDAYDQVLGNLMDRTALARYMVWDVTVNGDQGNVDDFVKRRGGLHVPRSGSVEVHNESVTWEAKSAQTGAYEDIKAGSAVMTLLAAGAGLSKTWLAEPDGANRATSMSMAEPVRRRVKGVQGIHLAEQLELVKFAVDRAVAKGRLKPMVESIDSKTGGVRMVRASDTVTMAGPEVAAADAQLNASVLLNLATGLEKLVADKILTPDAATAAARKAWEDYMGVPFRPELAKTSTDVDDVATHIDDQPVKTKKPSLLNAVS